VGEEIGVAVDVARGEAAALVEGTIVGEPGRVGAAVVVAFEIGVGDVELTGVGEAGAEINAGEFEGAVVVVFGEAEGDSRGVMVSAAMVVSGTLARAA
jgi:hypothetical protein